MLVAVASADMAPPRPPLRGEVVDDLPPPTAPASSGSLLVPAVAVGSVVVAGGLLGAFVVFRARR